MSHLDLWDQIATASEKWYGPPAPELLRHGELRALYRRATTHDATAITNTPLIAYPSAVPLRGVEGTSPSDLSALFFSPLIIRLNYIAQLSTTYMRANIDAKHCRLSHSLGTLSILSTLLEICVTRIKAGGEAMKVCIPSHEEIVAAFTYAALHDAFQGPFGHALDSLREDLVGGYHGRRLDKALLTFMLSLAIDTEEQRISQPPVAVRALSRVLFETVARPHGIPLLRLLKWLHHAAVNNEYSLDEKVAQRRRELSWLFELLEGPLDADRWDYLWRDTLHLGFIDDHEAIRELLWEFWADIRVAWDGIRSHIVVSQQMSERVGQVFFPLRKNLYRQVYENPEKRLIDGILVRCIYLMLLDRPVTKDWNRESREHFDRLCNLAHITDADLLSILERGARVRGLANHVVLRLVRSLSTYPAVKIVWQDVLRDDHFKNLVETSRSRFDKFSYKGVRPPKWVAEADDESPRERIRDIIGKTMKYLRERSTGPLSDGLMGGDIVALALHCTIMPIRPARNLQFERIVWKLICSKAPLRSITDKICGSLYDDLARAGDGEYRRSFDEIESEVGACPPIFVSFPWIADLSEASMREMTRDRAASTVFVDAGPEGILERSTADLMPKTQGSETYVAAGGYPLLAVEGLNDVEQVTFDLTLQWAIRRVVQLGCCLALPQDLLGVEHDQDIVDLILAQEPPPDAP